MSLIQQQAAIRSPVWIGGRYASRDPVPVQITTKRFEVKTRTSNLAMRVDRCFTLAAMPNIHNRAEFVLPWADVRESNLLEHLDVLAAIGQPFELGLWKQVYDVFDGDSIATSFLLQRRPLLPAVTAPTVLPDYPTRVIVYDGPYTAPASTPTELEVVDKLAATIDSGTPASNEAWIETDGHQIGNAWVATMRLGTAPGDFSDCVIAQYLPLYTVVIDQESARSYAAALVEPRGLKLVEFG